MPDLDEISVALGELREFARSARDQFAELKQQQERHHYENKNSMNRLATSTTTAIHDVSESLNGVKAEVAQIKTVRKIKKAYLLGGVTVLGLLGGVISDPIGKAFAAIAQTFVGKGH
jgi:hypothetical protein